MTSIPVSPANEPSEERQEVKAYCQSLVDAGAAQWRISDAGYVELHMNSGEKYRLGEVGITRLR
jgi:hypothetical protein